MPYTTRPLSLTYSGQWQGLSYSADFNVGAAWNWSRGNDYTGLAAPIKGVKDKYSYISNRQVDDDFSILKGGGNYTTALGDWQLHAGLSGQWARNGLPAGEQFGLAGSGSVRGFSERAVAADTGLVGNLEGFTPEVATTLGLPGSLRGLMFYDFAHGWNNGIAAPTPESVGISAWGLGLRYSYGKDIAFKADLGQIIDRGPLVNVRDGSWRGHFNLSVGF